MGSNTAASAFLGPNPELAMWSVDSFDLDGAYDATQMALWDAALRGLHAGAPDILADPSTTALDALADATAMQGTPYVPANGAVYPDTGLGNALQDIARLIKADVGLQVAAVDYGMKRNIGRHLAREGHLDRLALHAQVHEQLDLAAFDRALERRRAVP